MRVPELKGEDLDFVTQCLTMDPLKRPTAKVLLGHKYLSLERHMILQKHEKAMKGQEKLKRTETNRTSEDCEPAIESGDDILTSNEQLL